MAGEPSSAHLTDQPLRASSPAWLHARALWAGVSIVTIWLAVLFVGVFGSDFISTSSSGLTKIPVVVFVLPFALPATIVIGRRGFSTTSGESLGARDEAAQAHREATPDTSSLRPKPA